MIESEITKHWKLVTQDESVPNKEIPIKDGLIFGREETCDIYINSNHISRQHAKLEVLESLIRIKDLASANGLYLNGKQVTEAELKDGDVISIDKVKFSVLMPQIERVAEDNDKTMVRPVVDANKTQLRSAVVLDENAQLIEENTNVTQVLPVGMNTGSTTIEEKISQENIDLNFDKIPDEVELIEDEESILTEEEFDALEIEGDHNTSNEGAVNEAALEKDEKTELVNESDDGDSPPSRFELETPVASLIGKSKPFLREVFDINASPTSIGRVFSNNIVLDESSVSSLHAELRFEKGDWYIIDQDSYNGTYINKTKCKHKKLVHGDVIGFGRVQVQFQMLSKAKPAGLLTNKIKWLIAAGIAFLISIILVYFFVNGDEPQVSTTPVWTHHVEDQNANRNHRFINGMNSLIESSPTNQNKEVLLHTHTA